MHFLLLIAIQIVLEIGLSLLFQPKSPKATPVTAPTTDPTTPIAVLFGRALLGGNVFAFLGYRASPIHEYSGPFGITQQTVGYHYAASMAVGLCLGPVTKLWDIVADTGQRLSTIPSTKEVVGSSGTWETGITETFATVDAVTPASGPQALPFDVGTAAALGENPGGDMDFTLHAPNLYGGDAIGGGVSGPIHFFPGTRMQPTSSYWAAFPLASIPGASYTVDASGNVTVHVFFRRNIAQIRYATSIVAPPSFTDVSGGVLITQAPWTFTYSALSPGQVLFVGIIGYTIGGTPSPLASFSVTFTGSAASGQPLATGAAGSTITPPNYPNLCYVMYENTILSQSPYPRPLSFEVQRTPVAYADALIPATVDGDAHPIAILYELHTDHLWGLGMDDVELDLANSWAAASAALSEFGTDVPLYLSGVLDQQSPAQDYIDDILRTIDAVQFIDPLSGKLGIQLIRDDYTIGTLEVFNESNILDCDYTQGQASETVNEVKVTFSDRGRLYQSNQVKAQDLASVQALGRVISITNTYKWCTTEDLALRLAQRDLRARSTPLSKATLKVNRQGFDLHEGSPFLFSWSRAGVANRVMRVAKIQRPGRDDSTLTIECIQDVFSTARGTPAFTQQPATIAGTTFDNPSEGTAPAIPVVTAVQGQNATIGGVALTIEDPDSRVTLVQFQHQSGRGTMTPLTAATAPYHDQVTLDPQYASTINWVVTYATPDGTLDTITGTVTFDVLQAPPAPVLTYTIDASGNVLVTADVVSTVASVKFADSTSAPPSDATTRAASPVTGPFTYTPAASPLAVGATDYVTAFAYDAASNESQKATLTIAAPPTSTRVPFDLVFEFGDGVTAPSATAIAGDLRLDFNCTITQATIVADTSDSVVVDILTAAFANPPVFASIAASDKPTLASQTAVQDSTLTGWTIAIAAGTLIRAVLNSIGVAKKVTVTLKCVRT